MDEIEQLRKRIDAVDDEILAALCERVKVCKAIGAAKKQHGKPVRDAVREQEVYRRLKEKAVGMGLDGAQIEVLYREIVNMCSSVQE
jgi:chorismate mutase